MTKIENIKNLDGFHHGLGKFAVRQGRETLYGLLNAAGEIVLEPQPKRLEILSENKVELRLNERIKFDKVILDLKNNTTYSKEGYFEYSAKYNIVISRQRRRWGVSDINGNVIVPYEYRWIAMYNDVFIARNRKNRYGVLDSCGKELIPFDYDAIADSGEYTSPHPDRFSARQGESWFVIDRSGQRLSEKCYDCLGGFTESGYAIFGKTTDDGWPRGKCTRYGLIDKDERITIPAVFDHLGWLGNDRLSCGKIEPWSGDGPMCWKCGIIDSRGNMIISPSYPTWPLAGPDKTYIVCTSGCGSGNCVIDETGRIVVPSRNWEIRSMGGAYRIYDRQTERFGLYSSSGEELLPLEFDYIDVGGSLDDIAVCKRHLLHVQPLRVGDSLDDIAVCKGGEWYYVNQHGERVLL